MDFFQVDISPHAIGFVSETLRSGWISEGERVRAFEEALAAQLGLANPVAVNSGTSALHLALVVAGLGPGDEIIVPAQTFLATGLAVLMAGAKPIFADIDPRTGNVTMESIRAKITARTKAVVPVHWGGYPCDLDEIGALAKERGLVVIEDAAHALGGTCRGRPVGAVSRFTCFSFQAIKHLTTGDGGALCCRDPLDHQAARQRRWFGIDRENSQPSILGERIFDVDVMGFKYHMNDIAAALGLANLKTFGQNLARRQSIGAFYRSHLGNIAGLDLLDVNGDRTHAYWLFTVLVDGREGFIRKLRDHGIPSSVVHRRIDRLSVFGGIRKDLVGQQEFEARQVSLPIHPGLSDCDIEHIAATVRSGW